MADEERTYAGQMEAAREALRQGRPADAERLLGEALETGTRHFGAEHPSVATALAGLALVKRALGDDASAEQLYRDALRIREHALAPRHMATVVTMEQLSETCAARGNVADAVALLQRALPTREAALGADHPTVRSLRARIADLELQLLASNFASTEPQMGSWTQENAAVVPEPKSAPAASIDAPSLALARPARRKRFVFVTFAIVTAVALATAGMTARSRAEAGGVETKTRAEAQVATERVAPVASGTTAVSAPPVDTLLPDSQSGSATEIVQAGAPTPARVTPIAGPKLPHLPRNLVAVNTQLVPRADADSMVRASTKIDRELAADKLGPGISAPR